ncbi:MAG: tyrosine-type recombinase/integrase [Caldilineaceae bacterium]|nr:tyrosine-type recombinase/integrase [Caldilineaceae bacterium]MCB0139435.1 tyrosine-type recombinase/integrase [Caldilineaceae bacterium]
MQQIVPCPTISLEQTAATTNLAPMANIPADRNPALVYLASLAPGSRRTMRQALDTVADILTVERCDHVTLPWGALRFQHTQAVRAALQEKYSAATANKMLAALKQTLKFAWQLGYMNGEEYQQAVSFKRIIGEKPAAAAGRALRPGEWAALLTACMTDESPTGVRDAAMIAIFMIAGLRRFEVAALNLADYDQAEKTLLIRGKRNKMRLVPIEDTGAIDALADWLYTLYICDVQPEEASPLFLRIKKGGVITCDRLTDQGIYHILDTRRQQAKVAPFTPHDLRRTFAGDLLDAGVDLSTVQKLMGHSNSNTTAGYDRRGERAKREAVKKLHVPYTRRFEHK